jgi:hypothetical protein
MGFFEFFPFMECKHTVTSMQHNLHGEITINGKVYNFNGGLGYIEGDRGKSFPRKYFWTHAHLDNEISISASCAVIPYLGFKFTGTICFIHAHGREYRLATYRHAKVREFTPTTLHISQGQGRGTLDLFIEIQTPQNSRPLLAPTRHRGMTRIIHESIRQTVRYKLTHGEKVIFDETTDRAAYEFSEG